MNSDKENLQQTLNSEIKTLEDQLKLQDEKLKALKTESIEDKIKLSRAYKQLDILLKLLKSYTNSKENANNASHSNLSDLKRKLTIAEDESERLNNTIMALKYDNEYLNSNILSAQTEILRLKVSRDDRLRQLEVCSSKLYLANKRIEELEQTIVFKDELIELGKQKLEDYALHSEQIVQSLKESNNLTIANN